MILKSIELEDRIYVLEELAKQRERDIIEIVKFLNNTNLEYKDGKVSRGDTQYGKATKNT